MNTIYLLSADSRLEKAGGRLIVKKGEETICRLPIKNAEAVIVGLNGHITTPVLFELLKNNCEVFFMDWQGHVKGHLENKPLRADRLLKQAMLFSAEEITLPLIKDLVREKIENQLQLLRSFKKYYPLKKAEPALKKLRQYQEKVQTAASADELRGLEGLAARTYFDLFPQLLDPDRWPFHGRSQHPARDAVNALLNFGYAFLEREVRIAVAGSGLSPETGFFHSNNGRKDSLIFDLMEPFRQPIIDRFLLRSIHQGVFNADEFVFEKDNNSVRLGAENIRRFCRKYEDYMQTPYAALENNTPREYIRQRIKAFADRIKSLTPQEEAATGEAKEKKPLSAVPSNNSLQKVGIAALTLTAGLLVRQLFTGKEA